MPFPRKRREPPPQSDAAMRDLASDKQRAFVMHYVALGAKHGAAAQAARAAGYGTPTTRAIVMGRYAHRLLQDSKINRAVVELSKKELHALAAAATDALGNLVRDPKAKDHARGIDMVISRIAPAETFANVRHTVEVNHNDETLEALRFMKGIGATREKLEEYFGFSGLGRYEAMLAERDTPKQVTGPEPSQHRR